MLMRGLLTETADLLMLGKLDPASPAGRAIGYRQAIEFLSQEQQIAETGSTKAAAGSGGGGGSGGSGSGSGEVADPKTRFLQFYMTFAAKTRQYSGEQMKWFRSAKGRDFSWQAWDLGGPIKETPVGGAAAAAAAMRRNGHRGGYGLPRRGPKSRAGDGRDWRGVVASIAESFDLSKEAFEEGLDGEHQASLRSENQKRAGDMKRYVPGVSSLLADRDTLHRLVEETKYLVGRLREASSKETPWAGAAVGVREGPHGWHAGNR